MPDINQEELKLMAHRYLYYVMGVPLISDYEYDKRETSYLRNRDGDSRLSVPGSDMGLSYTEAEIAMASAMLRGGDR